jgi:hypothetical protein
MGNALNADLHGKTVLFRADAMQAPYRSMEARLFRVDSTPAGGGFGASAFTHGSALMGTFLADGEETRMDGWDVEAIVDEHTTHPTGKSDPACARCVADRLTAALEARS